MIIAMIGQKGIPAVFGGVERHVDELSKRLAARDLDVRVYARKWYTKETPSHVNGCTVIYTPSLHTKHLDTVTHVLSSTIHAMRSAADVIHYHGVGPALLAWIPRVFSPKKKIVVTFHSIDRKHAKWGWFARLMLRFGEKAACSFAHETIVVSRTIKQYTRDVYDCEAVFIPNGVPLYEKAKDTAILNTFGLEPNNYIVIVSRLIPHKGIQYAIEAFNNLTERNPAALKGKKLAIVGEGYYTDHYVKSLHKQAENNPNIIFTGFQSGEQLAQLFSHACLMLHPSDNEGLPITVLEAMSYGLPVLLSDIPEHMELVEERTFLFERGNIASLETSVTTLLEASQETLDARGRRNRQIIEHLYEWNRITDNIVHIYKRPLEKATCNRSSNPAVSV